MKRLRFIPLVIVAAAIAAVGWCMLRHESDLLWRVQELNLFLYTPLFFKQQMVVAGGMLTWLGTYFTQFFYHQAVGTLLLCLWWALTAAVGCKALRIPTKWATLMLVPVAMLVLTDLDMGYWIYYLKLRGHFFVATIGTVAALAAVWAYRLTPANPWLRTAFVVAAVAVLYPLTGFYALLAAALMAVVTWHAKGMSVAAKTMVTLCAVAAAAVVPLVFYRHVFYQTNMANIYWTALPLYKVSDEYPVYYTPYYILVASLLLMAAVAPWLRRRGDDVRRPLWWAVGQVATTVAVTACVATFWYKDSNFHKELGMVRCIDAADWEGVLDLAARQDDEPTRAIVMMRNLALFRLGRQGDEMYNYPQGAKASATPIPLRMTQVVGRTIYYHYGQLNYCYRWCLEDGVEYGWRAEYLKYLVRCAMLNGEKRVARKYIDILKDTRYFRSWAEEQERLMADDRALAADRHYKDTRHMLGYDDQLSSDNSMVEHYLMNMLANVYSNDTLMQEQTLLAAMWMKDIQLFWPRFMHYASLHPGRHMPRHYQEAACLYGHLENEIDISHMPFDPEVVKTYNDFMTLAKQCAGMTEEQMRPLFYPRFGKTFYYEYFFTRDEKLY